jgi:hypothetical protein
MIHTSTASAKRVSHFTSRVGRVAIAPALALGILLGASMPASAADPLPNGYASTYISCSQTLGTMTLTVNIKPRSGYSSQSVAYILYIQPLQGTGAWTSWSQVLTAPISGSKTVPFAGSANFTVYVKYAWWTGSSWTYAGEWITKYTQTLGGATYGTGSWTQGYCAV